MDLVEYELEKEKAKENLRELKELFKKNAILRKNEIYRDMRRVYGHMTNGGKVIDIHKSLKKAGVNIKGQPRVAIARADSKMCYLSRRSNGAAVFSGTDPGRWGQDVARKCYGEIELPSDTFGDLWNNIPWRTRVLKTPTPLIPPHIYIEEIKHSLKNYHILWEVDEWIETEPPVDPILLKKITTSLYGVLATWDLTELERAIIRGALE